MLLQYKTPSSTDIENLGVQMMDKRSHLRAAIAFACGPVLLPVFYWFAHLTGHSVLSEPFDQQLSSHLTAADPLATASIVGGVIAVIIAAGWGFWLGRWASSARKLWLAALRGTLVGFGAFATWTALMLVLVFLPFRLRLFSATLMPGPELIFLIVLIAAVCLWAIPLWGALTACLLRRWQ